MKTGTILSHSVGHKRRRETKTMRASTRSAFIIKFSEKENRDILSAKKKTELVNLTRASVV